jgi:WS/DGAT/MGAT family acyltransferase
MLQTAREVLERVPGIRDLPGMHRLATSDDDIVSRPGMTALRTSFNQRISQHRRFAFCSMDFGDVHFVKDAFGVNVNDVILAVCAGALRSWLDDRRELPTDPLLALVPLSVRDASGDSRRVSRVAAVITVLATQEPDPVHRLRLIAAAAKDARRAQNAVPASLLSDVSQFTSPGLASLAARVVSSAGISDVANPRFNLVITNIPGPQQPLYCAGARQVATYAVPVINDGVGLNISAMSYDGGVHVGAVSCRELMPDLWGLVRRIPVALAELRELAASGAGRGTTAPNRAKGPSKIASKSATGSTRSRSGKTTKPTTKPTTKRV